MIKKGIFAVALLAMLAVTVNAGDLAKNPLKVDSTSGTADPNNIQYMPGGWGQEVKYTFWWPYTINICYKPLEICQIPVVMEIGMYAEMLDCSKAKILLKQVACTSLDPTAKAKFGPAGAAGAFPCYTGCTDIQLRSNFNMQLGTVLYKTAVVGKTPAVYVIDDGKWQARYTTKWQNPGDVITGDGAYHKTELCVDAWSADIFYQTVGTQVQVGEVAVTVMPTGSTCCPTVQ